MSGNVCTIQPKRNQSTRKLKRWAHSLFILILFILPVTAEQKLTIASTEIPNLLSDKDGQKGQYNDFLKLMPEHSLIFMPPSRIEIEFEKTYIDCIFPASSQGIEDMSGHIESDPIEEIGAFVFSNDDSWKELRYPAIAIRHGFDYGDVRELIKARYVELPSDLDSAKLLINGRVDAMIAYLSDAAAALELLGVPMLKYDQSKPIYIQKDAMLCKDNPVNREFIEQVNIKIKQWREAKTQN